jgi:hypothetical protein
MASYGLKSRPRSWDSGCTGGSAKFSGLRWTGWGTNRATGRGTVSLRVCDPSCPDGYYRKVPGRLVLTRPIRCKGTRMYSRARLVYEGRSNTLKNFC